ncbi:hypothetical protein BFL43_07725 [Williamsia sp. 1135]|nr:hypothetical protein BFL43_07725 [Williamsia sp. 1135]
MRRRGRRRGASNGDTDSDGGAMTSAGACCGRCGPGVGAAARSAFWVAAADREVAEVEVADEAGSPAVVEAVPVVAASRAGAPGFGGANAAEAGRSHGLRAGAEFG